MYLPIGGDMAVRTKAIVGIFDLDNTTTSRHTRQFLQLAEQEGQVVSAAEDLPKAFLLTSEWKSGCTSRSVSQRTGSTQKNQPAAEGRCKPFRRCRLI